MTETTAELSSTTGDAQAIIDTATRAAEPTALTEGQVYSVVTPDGKHCLIDLDLDKYRDAPRRKQGTSTAFDAPSFLAVWDKHHSEVTDVWADVETFRIQAVLNAAGVGPGWGDHVVRLQVRKTKAWLAWESRDRRIDDQVAFAEHIEDRLPDFTGKDGSPSGAEMLEIAQTFQAHTKVQFEQSQRLASGERKLTYREDMDAKAGAKGDITIPESFTLAIVPFEGSDAYRVTARLRYRISGGQLRIGYVLDRPEDVLTAAFEDVVKQVREGIDTAVLYGQP